MARKHKHAPRHNRRFIRSFHWGDPAPLKELKEPLTGKTLALVRHRPQVKLLEEIHLFNGGFRVPSVVRSAMALPGNDNVEMPQDLKWQTKKGGMSKQLVPTFYLLQEDTKRKYSAAKVQELERERGCGAAYTKKMKKAA